MISSKNLRTFGFFCLLLTIVLIVISNKIYSYYINNSINNDLLSVLRLFNNIQWDIVVKMPFIFDRNVLIQLTVIIIMMLLLYAYFMFDSKNFKKNEEYGSSKWGKQSDLNKIRDNSYKKNIILSESEFISTNLKKTMLNNNVFCIGGPGTGKTRYVVLPNLLQAYHSYVITDPKGTMIRYLWKFYEKKSYTRKVFSTTNFELSFHYNPFVYLENEEDILIFVNALIENTTNSAKATSQDPFWDNAEKLIYNALISYLIEVCPKHEQNLNSMTFLLSKIQVQDDSEKVHVVDILFEDLEKENPNSYAVKQYKKFQQGPPDTVRSILATTGARLGPLDIHTLSQLLEYDELELGEIGKKKTAFFIIPDDTNKTFNFIVTLLQSQIIQVNKKIADSNANGELDVPIKIVFDEFANIGIIPNFDQIITVLRSRLISVMIFVQAQSQLKKIFDKTYETIIAGCSSLIFLGNQEQSTLDWMSKKIGKTTIDVLNINETHSINNSSTLNYSKIGRDLMSSDEISCMPFNKCLVFINGYRPFYSNKYNVENHPNYKLTGYYDMSMLTTDEEIINYKYKERKVL